VKMQEAPVEPPLANAQRPDSFVLQSG
jgi:hypothetical protein